MTKDESFRRMERAIEAARNSGSTELDLSGFLKSGRAELPESLGKLTQLQNLNLSKNRLLALPRWLGQLTQLRHIILSENQLTELPESLSQLTELQSLHLSGNQLTAIPKRIGELTQLRDLDLSENLLTTLPESLTKLPNLRQLRLSKNELRALPEWSRELTTLEDLNLSENQLTVLPESLGKLAHLQELNLDHNELEALPESFSQLAQLRELELAGNCLKSLPESLRYLKGLKRLCLNENPLEALPDWIGDLVGLENLPIGGMNFTSLPESLGNLKRITNLYIWGNPILVVPQWLCGLVKLRILNMNSTGIAQLPERFGDLEGLQTLFVENNKLVDLPISFNRLSKLAHLDLDRNPLNPELAGAFQEGLDAVKRYLRAKAEAQVTLNEAKLILIGEGEVGKSALLGALRGDEWVEKRDSTHGIEIKPLKVVEATIGTEITLNGWDFGGQRVYRPTHQLFFSAPAVYLVVWKPREGSQAGAVKEWIKLVKHREPEAKILVVATHGGPGARQPDIDKQEIWDVFGRERVIDFFHVESRPPRYDKKKRKWTGKRKGIDELKDAIAKLAVGLPEVGRSVPKRWQDVRETLKKTGEAYLPLDRVLGICGEHKMAEEEAKDFVRISHRLGHLIHYERDPALKEMVVLKPDWLATAMSFVLDDEETREKHGLVKLSRLSKLWGDRSRDAEFRYPAKVHPMFVGLMEKFDLSYRVAGSPLGGESDDTSLIAQLVPDVRPLNDLAREWPDALRSGDEQQVQICRIVDAKGQSAAAEGLFYQLIVRLHKLSLGREDFKASVHWQRGLILDDDYNGRALLEYVGNDVRIAVRAAYPGNLLAVLTREVKWLVEDFWVGLRCEVVVPCLEPCGKKLPGTGVFEVQKLIAFKRQGMALFPCTVSGCDQAQDIQCLLQNAPAARRTSIESLLTDGFGEMRSRLEELRQQNLVLDQGLRRIMSQVDDAFTGVMRTLIDEAKDGPRLFSLQPVARSTFNPNGWVKKKFRITLWCERTRLPLPLLNKHADAGVYEFDVAREWFAKAAPLLKVLTGTLSLVLPVAASATKLALDEAAYKDLENQLDFGKDCAEAMLSATEKTAEWLAEKEGPDAERTGVIRAEGGVLREFQAWLKEKDPSFGGLVRVQNKRQEFLWVHRKFESEY